MSGLAILAALAAAYSVWSMFPAASRLGAEQRKDTERTSWHAILQQLRRAVAPPPASRARDIAALTSALATELRSGQSPDDAWQHVQAAGLGLVPGLVVEGADVPAVLQRCARLSGWSGLAAVAVCWRLADATGAGLADALDRVGEAMRQEHEVTSEAQGQLSSTRATAVLLATLPIAAIAMGSVLGGDPLAVLLGSTVGLICLTAGLVLSALGWWWIAKQIANVREELQW
jgi:tight adherence protein B